MADNKQSFVLNGSIDLTQLMAWAKEGKLGAFNRGQKNNHVYVNVTVWVNEEPNQYGHHASLQLNASKEHNESLNGAKPDKCYFGNLKKSDFGQPKPVVADPKSNEFDLGADDDLPF